MWRADNLYDIVGILAWNTDPVVSGRGSAIFLHVARPDFGPTEGCVALALVDLKDLLKSTRPGASVCILEAPPR